MMTRTVLISPRGMRPTGLVDVYIRIAPKKIHMRAALKAIVLQPEQTLLIRIIPDIFPMMPVMLVSMANRPKARVIFFNRRAAAILSDISTVLNNGCKIITYLS